MKIVENRAHTLSDLTPFKGNFVATEFIFFTKSLFFNHYVSLTTHSSGDTLELVIGLILYEDLLISDHECIFFDPSVKADLVF